jgi:hypothetical protein
MNGTERIGHQCTSLYPSGKRGKLSKQIYNGSAEKQLSQAATDV